MVKFFGFVPEVKKFELLSRSHIMIFPSIHEGWGIVIHEAGIVGTPSAVYDVAGVKDVVRNGERGIMAKEIRSDLLAGSIIKVLKNDKLYKKLLSKIRSFEKEVGWEKTARVALSVIERYENRKN